MHRDRQIKISFDGEIKRADFPNTFEELKEIVNKCFSISIREFQVFYKDDDEDSVRISNQYDLDQATLFMQKQGLSVLKVNLKVDNFKDLESEFFKLDKMESNSVLIEQLKQDQNVDISSIITNAIKTGFQDAVKSIKSSKKAEKLKKQEKKQEEKKSEKKDKPKTEEAKKEKKLEVKKDENAKVHKHITCDGCSVFPITGIRYKCSICDDFDYCESCEEKNSSTHLHPFLKIRTEEQAPRKIFCVLKDGSESKRGCRGLGGFFRPVKEFMKNIMTNCNVPKSDDIKKDFETQTNKIKDFLGNLIKKGSEFGNKCGTFVNKEKDNIMDQIKENEIWSQIKENVEKVYNKFTKADEVVDINAPIELEKIIEKSKESPGKEIKVEDIEIISMNEVRDEVEKKEEVELVNENDPSYLILIRELRNTYDLSMYSNKALFDALVKAKGNPDNVFEHLFSD
jgi:hypothetical protein